MAVLNERESPHERSKEHEHDPVPVARISQGAGLRFAEAPD
jgi:hypothetical protein